MNSLTIVLIGCLVVVANCAAIQQQQIDPKFIGNIITNTINFGTDFWNMIIAEPINVLASNLAGMGALLFAGIADQGLGKREISDIMHNVVILVKEKITQFLYKIAEKIGYYLVLAMNQGKREILDEVIAKGLWSNITDSVFNTLNSGVQAVSLQIAQLLLHVSENGLLPTFGK